MEKEFLSPEDFDKIKEKLKKEIDIDTKEIQNFKDFAFQRNMVELAIAVIIGSAFNKVVEALSHNILMPIINFLVSHTGDEWREITYNPIGNLHIEIGKFVGTFIDFFIIAIFLYILYKKILTKFVAKPLPIPEPKECPQCLNNVAKEVKRCPHCTSWFN